MRSGLAQRLSAPGLRFKALSLSSKISLIFIVIIVLSAVLAPVISPFDPNSTQFDARLAPNGTNFFGTDQQGRDIFARILVGGRTSLMIGIGAVALALIVGGIIGSIAATSHKAVNETLMRIMDIFMAFPGIALAAVILTALSDPKKSNTFLIIVAIAVIYTPQIARIVRANVLAQYGEDYVRAEKVMGASALLIIARHILRNVAAPILVFATVMVADAIILEASLSFLGTGVKVPEASWGNIISDGRALLFSGGWWATTFPGLVILLTVLALNILSEGLTDAMVNPAIRKAVVKDDDGSAAAESTASPSTEVATSVEQSSVVEEHELEPVNLVVSETEGVAAPATSTASAMAALDAELAQLSVVEAGRTDRLPQITDAPNVLEVKDLSIRFPQRFGNVPIVDKVSFTVREGETMGLVGESGCGKSITSLAVMGLLPKSAQLSGSIKFNGKELLTNNVRTRETLYSGLRGSQIAMVYQDALSSLNPSMKIKEQMEQLTKRGGRKTPTELLELVKLDPVRTLRSYPHELSGGQRQRVLIAMALSRSPKIVVADEPTTALDVTVQKQVVDLLNELRDQLGFAMVFVSHDLALVASLAHRITVMYAGQVVESAQASELLQDPRHEYTRGLLGAVLSVESDATRLHQIQGTVPSPRDFAPGDRFAPRSLRKDADPAQKLAFVPVGKGDHYWASHRPEDAHLATVGSGRTDDSAQEAK